MKKYGHRERGSITVFLTLVLIPTIFLSGLLTDLARIKFYSNQALMTADNYGEAILTEYDNLLKELYGLFAVTQDEDGKKAIETLQEYMETSFHPSKKTVSFGHLQGTFLNKGTAYDGFMPYRAAELEIGYEPASGEANLANESVLSTQIGDFMRYRIIQSLADDGSELLAALEGIKNAKADADVMDAKQDLDEQVEKALKAQEDFYHQLLKMDGYYELYLKDLNKEYQNAKERIDSLVESDRYKAYIEAAEKEEQEDKKAEDAADKANTGGVVTGLGEAGVDKTVTDAKEAGTEEGEAIDLEEEGIFFSGRIKAFIAPYIRCFNDGHAHDHYAITFLNYDEEAKKLYKKALALQKEMKKITDRKKKVETSLATDDVSGDVKTNVKKELDERYATLTDNTAYTGCMEIAELFRGSRNKGLNRDFYEQALAIKNSPGKKPVKSLLEAKEFYLRYYTGRQNLYPEHTKVKWVHDIKIADFVDFKEVSAYEKFYETLKKTFAESAEENSEEKKAKKKKNEAEEKTSDVQDELKKEDESSNARNIPAGVPIGDSGKAGLPKLTEMVKSAATLLNCDLGEAKDELLLKAYTVSYDFGMFSSRVTNVKKTSQAQGEGTGSSEQIEKESLTGYKMCEDINYLYQAELEYLYGGHKNSVENLKETRNIILTFRMAMNLAATYSVNELNQAIKVATEACMAINPVLGLAVAAALRTGVAALESYKDWEMLKKGDGVILFKRKLGDLSAIEDIEGMLNLSKSGAAEQSQNGIKMDYEQYIMVLLIALTPRSEIARRTGDLICLNVNNVKNGSDFTQLSFRMEEALTAVKASCSVHLNYVVMPEGFAQKSVDADTYSSIMQFEKNKYKYSVVRGY